ncbi:MAG: histidine phosphatase family protein [Minisyncoccia bacterium]
MSDIVYLVRHADYVFADGLEPENRPSHLSRAGRVQAYVLALRLRFLRIDAIYTSSYTRAHETAMIISKVTGAPLFIDDRFAEFSPSGTARGVNFKEARTRARRERDWHESGGQSFNDSVRRFSEALNDAALQKYARPCVVTHALVLQNFLLVQTNNTEPPELDTASITAFSPNAQGFVPLSTNTQPFPSMHKITKILRYLIG